MTAHEPAPRPLEELVTSIAGELPAAWSPAIRDEQARRIADHVAGEMELRYLQGLREESVAAQARLDAALAETEQRWRAEAARHGEHCKLGQPDSEAYRRAWLQGAASDLEAFGNELADKAGAIDDHETYEPGGYLEGLIDGFKLARTMANRKAARAARAAEDVA